MWVRPGPSEWQYTMLTVRLTGRVADWCGNNSLVTADTGANRLLGICICVFENINDIDHMF